MKGWRPSRRWNVRTVRNILTVNRNLEKQAPAQEP